MNSITLSGKLELQSNNGDGAQMLTEAAEFVSALAQMGVQLGVRIALAPVEEAPSALQRVANELPKLDPVTPAPAAVAAQRSYNKDDGRTFETVPAAALTVVEPPIEEEDEANPQPAAPAQPDEPLTFSSLSAARLEALNSGALRFRDLDRSERLNVLTEFGAHLTRRSGSVPSQAMWDKAKPHWMPSGAGASSQPLPGWPTSWNAWQTRFGTMQGTPSGLSALRQGS